MHLPLRPRFLALGCLAFVSLGAAECTEGDLLAWVARTLGNHEQRIEKLEDCDCEGVLAPVCGDDGRTYVSPCQARCAGVSIAGPGACDPPECGGVAGTACEDGELCEIPPGCGAFAPGMCISLPEACTEEFDPVCGCDGTTYSNDCHRRAAGVALEHRGECGREPIACETNHACAIDEYCARRAGLCDAGPGRCLARPMACTREFDPVCGCDGETYPNRCVAASSGASVGYPGECRPQPVACFDTLECGERDYCHKPLGACDGEGRCRARPELCPLFIDPVCGCDGETYDNACEAAGAGTSVDVAERCEPADGVICHIPPGNPSKRKTLHVGSGAIQAHLGHGDYEGPCED